MKLIETLADEDDGDEEAEEAIEATERAELEGLPLLAASQAAAE